MHCRIILALILSFCTFLAVLGQTTPQTPTQPKPTDEKDDVVKITTNLVQVDAVVTKDGKPVKDLKAEDFEIYEDGRRQAITSFAYISNVAPKTADPESAAPDKSNKRALAAGIPAPPIKRDVPRRIIAIVVDDLGLSFQSMSIVRNQVRKFVAERLEPNDLVAIIRTGGEVGVLQQFTNDSRLLRRAADKLTWNYCSRMRMTLFDRFDLPSMPGDGRDPCNNLAFPNTLRSLHFILDSMGRLPGRKSLIFMSDSMPIENQEPLVANSEAVTVGANVTNNYGALRKIAEKAIRSSVVIYSVDTQALQYTGITAADQVVAEPRAVMGAPHLSQQSAPRTIPLMTARSSVLRSRREGGDMIAAQTGGFQIRNSNDFQLDRILEDQSGYYLIGYRPTDETFNRKFHHIKAKVKRSGMTVRTRFGFFGVTEEEAERAKPTPQDTTNLALMSPFGSQDLELGVNAFFADSKTDGSVVRSFVHLNAQDLTFTPVNDRHETAIEVHGVIFGDNGAIVEQLKNGVVLTLRQTDYDKALRDGLRLRFDMPVKRPGSYQVRVAVRDRTSAKVGSAGQFVAVPDLKKNRLATSGIVLRPAGEESSTETALMATPTGRRFRVNSDVEFAFVIYNAAIDPATQLPKLVMETRLFRDGQVVKSAAETALNSANQPDLARLSTSGVMRLQDDLEPGNYYLEVVITDRAAKNKQPPVTQWVDFEIVK